MVNADNLPGGDRVCELRDANNQLLGYFVPAGSKACPESEAAGQMAIITEIRRKLAEHKTRVLENYLPPEPTEEQWQHARTSPTGIADIIAELEAS